LLSIAGAIVVSRNTEINSLLAETFDENNPQIAHMQLIESQLGGFMPMEVVFTAQTGQDPPTSNTFQRADTWHRLVAIDHFVHARSEVLFSRSLVDLYRQVDQLLPGGPQLDPLSQLTRLNHLYTSAETYLLKFPIQEISEEQKSLLEKRLQDIHHALQRQAKFTGYSNYLSVDGRQARHLLRMRDQGTHQDRLFADILQHQLAHLFPPGCGVKYQITGEAYVAAIALNQFIRDLFFSLSCVSLFIFLVIGVLLQSPRLGLISILPNITPLAITMGYIGLRGYSLSMSNVIVFAISLGVAVDDTIHFLARFREELEISKIRGETDVLAAIRRTCLGTGRAILMTTLLIVCGLAVLLLSAFVPTRRFAELSAVTMISALLGDLLLLPASLKLFWPRIAVSQPQSSAGKSALRTPSKNNSP
jgi:predicted RND superfamily exporter protein